MLLEVVGWMAVEETVEDKADDGADTVVVIVVKVSHADSAALHGGRLPFFRHSEDI